MLPELEDWIFLKLLSNAFPSYIFLYYGYDVRLVATVFSKLRVRLFLEKALTRAKGNRLPIRRVSLIYARAEAMQTSSC